MKKKSVVVTLLVLCSSMLAHAQQLPAFSSYRDNWGTINPAGVSNNFIVFDRNMSINAATRQPMSAIPEAPKTQVVSFEYATSDYQNQTFSLILGGHVLNDRTGAFGQTGAYANIACRMAFRNSSNSLVAGFNLGGVQYRAKLGEILAGTSEVNNISDEEIKALDLANSFNFDVGTGVMLYLGDYSSKQNYYLGVSVPQTFARSAVLLKDNKYTIERVPHIYLTAGMYLFAKGSRSSRDQSFTEIALWSRYLPNAPISIDGSVRYHFEKAFWFGAGGGTSKTLRLETGIDIGDDPIYRVALGYNYSLSGIRNIFGQAVEVSFSYTWSR